MQQYEEESILKEQHFDLIYAQSRYLYIVLLNSPQYHYLNPPHTGMSHSVYGIIGSISLQGKYPPQLAFVPSFMVVQYPPITTMLIPPTIVPNPPFGKLQYGVYSTSYLQEIQAPIVPPPQIEKLAPTSHHMEKNKHISHF